MIKLAGTDRFIDLDQRGQWHHGLVAPPDVKIGDIGRFIAGAGFELNDDIVLITKTLIAGHLTSAQGRFKQTSDLLDLNPRIGDAIAIEANFELGLIQTQVTVDALHAWPALQFVQHLLHHRGHFWIFIVGHYDHIDRSFTR